MAIDKKKLSSTRDGFGWALVELGETNKNVVVLSADLTESVRAHWFKEKFPDRFISHGVAEQDMICAAAAWRFRARSRSPRRSEPSLQGGRGTKSGFPWRT